MSRPNDAGKGKAGLPQPSVITGQQRLELEQLADIFACVFGDLTPEQQANYMSVDIDRKAA